MVVSLFGKGRDAALFFCLQKVEKGTCNFRGFGVS